MSLRTKLREAFQRQRYRHAYVEDFLDSYLATQIKVLREQRKLTQEQLADLANLRQSQISALEDVHHDSWTIKTLRKLARAFDLTLVVRFESFGVALADIETFSRETLERPSFDQDPVFAGVSVEATAVTTSVSFQAVEGLPAAFAQQQRSDLTVNSTNGFAAEALAYADAA